MNEEEKVNQSESLIKFLLAIGFEDKSTEEDKKKGKKYFKFGRNISIKVDELDREIEVYKSSVLIEIFKISKSALIHIIKK